MLYEEENGCEIAMLKVTKQFLLTHKFEICDVYACKDFELTYKYEVCGIITLSTIL